MIYIDVEFDPETETLESFIPKCLSKADGLRFKPTYSDPELTIQQCRAANRSFGAVLELCQTYFPGCTEKDVAIVLNNLCGSLRIDGNYSKVTLICLRCTEINKIVFLGYNLPGDSDNLFARSNVHGMLKYSILTNQDRYHIQNETSDKYDWKYLKNLIEQNNDIHQGSAAS